MLSELLAVDVECIRETPVSKFRHEISRSPVL